MSTLVLSNVLTINDVDHFKVLQEATGAHPMGS